jgi:hypothetical protein
VSPGGRHGHTLRELRRRMDAVLEEERARRGPVPPPISAEHAAMRDRIERGLAALLDPQDPERSIDELIEELIEENPGLASAAAQLLGLMREEWEFLASLGVDPRPYERYEPKF